MFVNTDNMTSQQVLSSGADRDPIICECARQIWLIVAQNSTDIVILHKPGKDIVLADALSRMGFDHRACSIADGMIADTDLSPVIVSHDHILDAMC